MWWAGAASSTASEPAAAVCKGIRTVNLLPTVALMAQLSLGALLGLPGLLLALPLVVVLQVLGEEVLVRDIMDRWDGR